MPAMGDGEEAQDEQIVTKAEDQKTSAIPLEHGKGGA